jgi:hypothetical protein
MWTGLLRLPTRFSGGVTLSMLIQSGFCLTPGNSLHVEQPSASEGKNSSLISQLLFTKYHSGDQVKKTKMGRTRGTYGGEERCIQGFSGET